MTVFNQGKMKVFHVHQPFHLGDNIYNIHLYRKLIEANSEIIFIYYVQSVYIKPLNDFIKGYEDKIILKPYNERPLHSINSWINEDNTYYDKIINNICLEVIYYEFYQKFCKRLGLDCPINDIVGTYLDYTELLEPNALTTKNDYLIANSDPFSGQWVIRDEFKFITDKLLEKNVKIISLQPTGISLIPCTRDYGLNLLQVGNIAINSRYIFGVHSAPFCTIINKYNYNKIEKCGVFHIHGIKYSGNNFYSFRNNQEVKNRFFTIF